MLLLCFPKCSTCQRAQRWLDGHGISYDLRDIKLERPTLDELKTWYAKSGLPLKRFFNTSGLIYKNMQLKERLPEMGEGEQLMLLSSDGLLVKRRILIGDGFVLVGFKESEWAAELGI